MSVSSAARKLQDLLSGAVTLTRLTKGGPVEVDSPRCASARVAYERRTRRPGDGEWLIEWQGGPTSEQMRGYVASLADVIARDQTAEPDVTKSRNGSLCERCGGPLPASARPDARFCSAACRQATHRARHPVTKFRDTSCAVCGKPVPAPSDPHRAGRHAAHCSHACRQTAYRRRRATAASQPDALS